jgi:hypothetical protein
MNHIQRCLSALTAVAGALLAVFIMQVGRSVAVDRAMPNESTPSGDILGSRCRGWPRAVATWGVLAPRRAGAMLAAAAAATITITAAACGSHCVWQLRGVCARPALGQQPGAIAAGQ